jgi:hypothetical protein
MALVWRGCMIVEICKVGVSNRIVYLMIVRNDPNKSDPGWSKKVKRETTR